METFITLKSEVTGSLRAVFGSGVEVVRRTRRPRCAALASYPRALRGVWCVRHVCVRRVRCVRHVRVSGGVVRAARASPLSGGAHQRLVVSAMHRNSDSACWKQSKLISELTEFITNINNKMTVKLLMMKPLELVKHLRKKAMGKQIKIKGMTN